MGDGAHGQWATWLSWFIWQIEMGYFVGWGTWAMGHMGISLLILQGSSPKFNST